MSVFKETFYAVTFHVVIWFALGECVCWISDSDTLPVQIWKAWRRRTVGSRIRCCAKSAWTEIYRRCFCRAVTWSAVTRVRRPFMIVPSVELRSVARSGRTYRKLPVHEPLLALMMLSVVGDALCYCLHAVAKLVSFYSPVEITGPRGCQLYLAEST